MGERVAGHCRRSGIASNGVANLKDLAERRDWLQAKVREA
jgi:hypothetical protein